MLHVIEYFANSPTVSQDHWKWHHSIDRIRVPIDMRNLSLGRRHLVNAYEVGAGIGVIAGNTV